MFSKVGKLCQRRLYTWLSSRRGLPVCVIGLLIALISLLQFGEVLLEWSKERYALQFSIYADNIAGRSFEEYMLPTLPIDIVYTWVNGSDPQLLTELRQIRKQLTRSESEDNSNHTASVSLECPFQHCTTWRTLVIDARNLSSLLINSNSLSALFPALSGKVVWVEFINETKGHLTPVYAARLRDDSDVNKLVMAGLLMDHHDNNVSVREGFLTTDDTLVGGVKMEQVTLAISDGICPTNTSKLLRRWMDSHFSKRTIQVEVRGNQTAVVEFRTDALDVVSSNNSYMFCGSPLRLYQAFLVWLPFSLPDNEHNESKQKAEQISSSRFQDNEELRYSLRSVEQFSPWVRHIYVVTNGQIPSWLNLENPRITLVTHEELFVNQSHLPTYSSPAIESHIHRIPGLSDHFIYLNDDVMFGEEVWPEDFYTNQQGQKVFLSWPVPQCAEGCPATWITDHYCDRSCNNSACDWDGGDCANATAPGYVGGIHSSIHTSNPDYCNTGCLNNWLGDRYCDTACRVRDCGYDAGDCGTERWEELLSYQVGEESGGHFDIPLGTKALFLNLTNLFHNGTISSAEYSPTPLVRTAVVTQKFKTLAITLNRNITLSSVNYTIVGKDRNDKKRIVKFTLTGDTHTKNETRERQVEYAEWMFNFNDTQSDEFLQAVAARIKNVSVGGWPTVRPTSEFSPPLPISFPKYIITNMSRLSLNTSTALQQVEEDYRIGDLTERGYWTRKVAILESFRNLLEVNGTVRIENGEASSKSHDKFKRDTKERHLNVTNPLPSRVELLRRAGKAGEGEGIAGGTRRLLNLGPVLSESRRRSPWERWHVYPELNSSSKPLSTQSYGGDVFRTRRLLGEDYFANSLRHVNKLYTRRYGHDARKVPAHMPHFIQRKIMARLQEDMWEHFDRTSSHHVRASDDMQFAFSYFYYLMSERESMDLEDIFRRLDTDRSGILSVRELRTLLTVLGDLPVELKHVESFQAMLESCDSAFNGTRPSVEPIEYETSYDPDLPLVTLEFLQYCKPLIEKLKEVFKVKRKYKYEEVDEKKYIIFQMISENGSVVMSQLDHIRRERKKFICLNDNINHEKEGASLAKLILVDFYETLFPIPSQFELSHLYQNRFQHVRDLREWLKFRDRVQTLLHSVCAVLLMLCVISLFYGKLLQCKRKVTRFLGNCLDTRTSAV